MYYSIKRVYCPEHGVITESVPWAFPDSRFTKDFDLTATFLAMNINKAVASEYMRCDWHTIIRCITRAREYLEPDIKKRYNSLINIGINETSYRKGHNYLTVVVNQDTNTVVWCAQGHSKEVLSKSFKELTQEQRDSIKTVSGDGARWIDACVNEYIPNATRCIDPFHVVSWANESVDTVRKESWREAHKTVIELSEDLKRKRGRPKKDDKESTKLNKAEEVAKEIKTSLYTLGKNPENLTEN
ncbi:MAG: transposase [Succinivibrionaceae bacterium]